MPRWLDALVESVRGLTTGRGDLGAGRTVRKQEPTARPVEAGVRIEYTPQLDGDPDPGEVIWTWVPYEDDPSLGKDRPVVIVGRHGALLSGVALTSQAKDRRDYVEVGSGSWDSRGRQSYAEVDRLLDIDPLVVRREGAILSRRRFDAVIEAVDRIHDVAR